MSNLAAVEQYFRERPPLAIAVSGGVDSMTLAVVAHRAQPGTSIFHALSPAVPALATQRVKQKAAQEGWALTLINAGEMLDPQYLANPANRCYFCKTNLYDAVARMTRLKVASGTNLDDLGDYRPGLIAAEEHQVCHPWVELGIDKQGLRGIADELGLDDLKDLPAAPCLSSRVTTGIAIDAALLPIIDEAERLVATLLASGQGTPAVHEKAVSGKAVSGKAVREKAVSGIRCRILPTGVAVQLEIPALGETDNVMDREAAWSQIMESPVADQILKEVGALFAERGYPARQVTLEPYRKGSAFLVDAPLVDTPLVDTLLVNTVEVN